MTDNTEYEANLFSANLLVSDEEMEQAYNMPMGIDSRFLAKGETIRRTGPDIC